jgi:hypothetical protein
MRETVKHENMKHEDHQWGAVFSLSRGRLWAFIAEA